MYVTQIDNFRRIGRSLYQLIDGSFIHVALIPARIKTTKEAIKWFKNLD